jgi:outer membrane protein assembly factor BamB
MKKSTKIILSVVVVVLLGGVYFAYQIFKIVNGSEPLSGKFEGIPETIKQIPPLTYGTADWSHWRGPNFDGKSAVKGIQSDWSQGLKKLWQVNYLCQGNSSATWSSPVIQGNRLVVSGRGEKNDLAFCLDSESGELIWVGSYEAEAGSSHGPGPRATPCIDGDRVYTFGRSGDLVCWQLSDGKLLWRKNVKELGGAEPTWGFSCTPLILDDKIIVQGGGTALVVAFSKLSGDMLWKSMEGDVGYSAAIPVTCGNEQKVLIYHGEGLSCLNPADGIALWTVPWPTEYGVNATTPIVSNDLVFHTSGYKAGCQLIKISQSGYSVVWKSNVMEAQHSDPILIDGYIYGYSGESSRNNGQFKCIELQTGKEVWSTGKLGQGTTTFVDGYLICLNIKGDLALIKPDPAKFMLVGTIHKAIEEVKNPAWTVPVVANGKLYLRYLQQLVCYQL